MVHSNSSFLGWQVACLLSYPVGGEVWRLVMSARTEEVSRSVLAMVKVMSAETGADERKSKLSPC